MREEFGKSINSLTQITERVELKFSSVGSPIGVPGQGRWVWGSETNETW